AVVGWARGLVGPRGALAAGAILAVAPTALETSANVREYSLAIALIVAAAWSYTRRSKVRPWTFVVAVVLAFWTSYLTLGLLMASVVDALARPERRNRLPWIVGAAASILPWLAFASSRGLLRAFESQGPRQASSVPEPFLPQLWILARTLTGGEFLTPTWV